ncbi:MAG: ATP-binding protein [Pseudomonadota bacterium]
MGETVPKAQAESLQPSLFARVMWQVLPAAVLILLLIWFAISSFVRQMVLDNAQEKISLEAQNYAEIVEQRIDTLFNSVRLLANNQLTVNGLIDTVGRNSYLPALISSSRLPVEAPVRLTMTDYRGRVIAANHYSPEIDSQQWLTQVMQDRDHFAVRESGLLFATPIRYYDLPEGALVAEIDRDGLALMFKLSALFLDVTVQHERAGILFENRRNAPQTGEGLEFEWLGETVSLNKYSGFSVVVREQQGAALEQLKTLDGALMIAFVLDLIALLIGLTVTGRKVIKPIRELESAFLKIGETRSLDTQIKLSGGREIEILSAAMNDTLSSLREALVSRSYLSNIVAATPELVMQVSSKGDILAANPQAQRLLGEVGSNVLEFVEKNSRDSVKEQWFSSLLAQEPLQVEWAVYAQDGTERTIFWHLMNVGKTAVPEYFLFGSDVTEIRNAQVALVEKAAELEAKNSDLQQFTYAASHDLKAPLRGVAALVDWVEEDYGPQIPEAALARLKQIRERIVTMDLLLTDLLSYARLGSESFQAEDIQLSEMLVDIVKLIDPPPKFNVIVPNRLPALFSQRPALEQVLRNLIHNGIIHHNREDGCVWVHATRNRNTTTIVVEDDGPGIEPRYRDRVFEIFKTLQSRTSGSTGMGLAIVLRMVELAGGTVTLDDSPRGGCRFTIVWVDTEVRMPAQTA